MCEKQKWVRQKKPGAGAWLGIGLRKNNACLPLGMNDISKQIIVNRLDCGHLFIGQRRKVGCKDIAFHLGSAAGAGNHHADGRIHQDPADSIVRKRCIGEDSLQTFNRFQCKIVGNAGEGFRVLLYWPSSLPAGDQDGCLKSC